MHHILRSHFTTDPRGQNDLSPFYTEGIETQRGKGPGQGHTAGKCGAELVMEPCLSPSTNLPSWILSPQKSLLLEVFAKEIPVLGAPLGFSTTDSTSWPPRWG